MCVCVCVCVCVLGSCGGLLTSLRYLSTVTMYLQRRYAEKRHAYGPMFSKLIPAFRGLDACSRCLDKH